MATTKEKKKDHFWLSGIGRLVFTLVCLGIIVGCVMTCIFSVLVFNFVEGEPDIDLTNLKQSYTTILFANDRQTGESYELTRVYATEENRIWVPIEKVPQHLINVTIAAEDARFRTHGGIDWKRTIAATVGHFIGKDFGGGSTIEQQLIKNVLNHTKRTIPVKIQEIFGAVKLDKSYSKDQIIEAYLNTVPFGNQTKGVQSASNLYFGKDVSDLSLAESCAIITLTNAPSYYSLYTENGVKNNANRRKYILDTMLQKEMISQEEHDKAVEEEVKALPKKQPNAEGATRTWFEDYVITEVCKDLAQQEGITEKEAMHKILNDGYRIYTTVDERAQKSLEEKYKTKENFPKVRQEVYPETAAFLIEKNGSVAAVIGGNEKEGDLVFNRAIDMVRPMGSTMKPISPYLQAMEMDLIHWSSVFADEPIMIPDEENPGEKKPWPVNNDNIYRGNVTVQYALEISLNTIPAQLLDVIGTEIPYNFLVYKLGFEHFIENADKNSISSMAVGGTAGGTNLKEMVGAYQIFSTNGLFVEPYCYTRVEDSSGEVILEKDTEQRRVISSETATVMNRLMQLITSQGSGRGARLNGNVPTAGKTGTSTAQKDLWFIGATPKYVAGVWMGYDVQKEITYQWYPPPLLWKAVFGDFLLKYGQGDFEEYSDNVIPLHYCAETGKLATDACEKTLLGWYKLTNIPEACSLHDGSPIDDVEAAVSAAREKDELSEDGSQVMTEETKWPWEE